MQLKKENIEDILDLTGTQQGMLYHYISDTNSLLYQEQMSITLEGLIDIENIKKTWNKVVEDNEMLRTVFQWQKLNKPVQVVLKKYDIPFEVIDLSGELDPNGKFHGIFKKKQNETINIEEESIKITICKISENIVNIIIKNHHILYDGWSNGIILNEFIKTYNSYIEGQQPVNKNKNKFKNYIKAIKAQNKEKSQEFWQEYLKDFECKSAEVEESTDKKFKKYCYKFDQKTEKLLEVYGKTNRVSKATVLYSIWGILQSKYRGETDMVFGTPVSGRIDKVQGINDMVGLFINTVPLRMRLSYSEKVNKLIKDVDLELNKRLEHENTSLIDIKKYSNISSKETLFDTIMVIENYPLDKFIYENNLTKITGYKIEETTNFDLTIEINTFNNLEMNILYNCNRFDEVYIRNMASGYESLINQVIEENEIRIDELEIVTDKDKQKLLLDFNDSYKEYEKHKTLHKLFEEQVEMTPNNIAVVFQKEKITYRELNEKANALARTLIDKGVKQDDIVGIMVDRSFEMIIGILGILKAGGAYLPISPKYPEDRINYILKDSAAKLLLTQEHIKINDACPVINLMDQRLYEKNTDNIKGSNYNGIAYVIYTSGSTGNPKGIKINHRSAINTLTALQCYYPMGNDGAYLQKTNYMFDVSVSEIFGWFIGGGRLILLNNGEEKEVSAVIDAIENNSVTHINFTSSMFNLFLNELNEQSINRIGSLKYILTAGEALKINIENKAKVDKLLIDKKIENLYGPTEAAIYATKYSLQNSSDKILIGKPLSNTKIYILDSVNKLLPLGVPGELCIAGDGIALGYLNNEKLTNEKFIQNPYNNEERLYKTGDLARWLPDGNIEYLGRMDYQVKIRGFRIELEEIENNLCKIEGIKESIVIDKGEDGSKYLCAYYIGEKEYDTGYIRQELKNWIPDYMIPSYYIKLEKMPLTSNGKIDRKLLPNPDGNINTGQQYEAANTEVEKMLVEVWSKVLGVKDIGINDDFFNLGGDSIKAIQVSARVKNKGYFLSIKDLLKNTTIKELSRYIKANTNIVEQGVVEGEVSLTPIQKRFFEEQGYNKNHCNQAVMLFKNDGFEEAIVKKVFDIIVTHHDALRMKYEVNENEVKQINRGIVDGLYDLEIYDLRDEEDVNNDYITDKCTSVQESIDINGGALVKLGLFKTKMGDHLLIAIHHLVVDGVSWRIIFEDFNNLYNSIANGESVKLPDKTTSFKDWADKQQEYSNSYSLNLEEKYWLDINKENIKELPKDKAILQRPRKHARFETVVLSEEITEKLLKEANRAYNTEINDILLAALVGTISEWAETDKVLIDVESHGREEILEGVDITRTIGWFTSIHPILLKGNSLDVADSVKNIKDTLRRVPNEGIGYGILRCLRNENKLEFKQKSEICFNYLGQFDEDIDDGVFKLSNIGYGEVVSADRHNPYALDISGIIEEKKLKLTISYDKDEYKKETINYIVNKYKSNLTDIISHCVSKKDKEITASDITNEDITLEELKPYNCCINNIEGIYPLTPMQEGMLFHSLVDDNQGMYHELVEVQIKGELDIETLEESFKKLVEKYSILRTSFDHKNFKNNMQIVYKKTMSNIRYEDITLQDVDARKYIENVIKEDIEKGYSLQDDKLIRMMIIKTDDNKYSLILSYHHIIMDGWSLGIIIGELFKGYNNIKYKENAALIDEKPYSEYIKWINKKDKNKAEKYWKEYLADYTDVADVAYSKGHTGKEYENRSVSFKISKEFTRRIEDLARKNKVTVNSIMQSIWALQLQKYNNSRDIVFGYVVSGRNPELKGIEDMVGLFINTIPVRVKAEKNTKYIDVIKGINDDLISNESYSYYPLAEIQNLLDLEKQLVNNIMVFENYPIDEEGINNELLKKNSIEVTGIDVKEQTNYNFNIIISYKDEMDIKFSYNSFEYSEESVNNIRKHFENILKEVIKDENILVEDITMLDKDEKQKLLIEFNNTYVEYPKNKTIHELFEEQVQKTPNNVAIVFKNQEITYKDLNEEANQLARLLIDEYSVRSGDVVAIHLDRSMEMIIAILATLKAGAASLPIETKYPNARVTEMVTDSQTKVILNNDENTKYEGFKGKTLKLIRNIYVGNAKDNIVSNVNSNDLAYLIYTSGSTGKPKAVKIEHKGIINHAFAKIKETNMNESDICCHNLSFNFVASIWQMFSPMFLGSRVYLYEDNVTNNGYELFRNIENHKVSIVEVVPSLLNSFLEIEDEKANHITMNNVRKILLTGERVPVELVNKFYNKYKIELINAYGQSEFSDDTIHYHIPYDINTRRVLIGKPTNNTRIYILDKSNKMVPIGVPGEIYISGDGIAKGYLNNEELTAEKFIENPYEPGNKMYKTGDLAKWVSNGNIEFLGRLDQQVKIRGFRIELGEIQNNLAKIEGIKECIVIDKGEDSGKYLSAYYVGEQEIDEIIIKEELRKTLPEYMVPTHFNRLEIMPLTPNGKIDRKQLLGLADKLSISRDYEAPRNELEEKLVGIWCEVLGIDKLGINDNFFDLGGHSLKATLLAGRIHKNLNMEIPLKDLFKLGNIKCLSEYMSCMKETAFNSIEKIDEKGFYEASSAQKRMYVLQELDKESIAYNMPGAIEIRGKLDFSKVKNAFKKLIEKHETLRTSFDTKKNNIIQKIHNVSDVDIPLDKICVNSRDEIDAVLQKFIKPFNLSEAPLLRACVIEIQKDQYILAFDMHHIISDGTSMSILTNEFVKAYEGKELEPLAVQYKDYVVWQEKKMNSEEFTKQEKYWLNEFSGEIPVLNLPTDYAREKVKSFDGGNVKFMLDDELENKLKTLARETDSTMYMVLLSNLNILLSKYSGQEEIIVGSPIAGRNHRDLEDIIGMFINTLAIRSKVDHELNYKDYLKSIREKTLTAYENQDYQFEELVDKVKATRDLSRNPLFDVMLILQNMEAGSLEIKDLSINAYNIKRNVEQFDITLNVIEENGKMIFDLSYSTNLYKEETIVKMVNNLLNIMKITTDDRDIKIKDIEVIGSEEKNRILVEFNDTHQPYSIDKTIHQLFEEQVAKIPNNIAVVFKDKEITYAQLNEKSNALARTLRDKGIGTESVVGIMVERSIEMVVGIMAILKSGAAYLPIDMEYPRDRINYMLENSGAKTVLTYSKFEKDITVECEVIDIDNRLNFSKDVNNLNVETNSSNLAYIIYTSGTTGNPKGVAVEQRSVINLIDYYVKTYAVCEETVILQTTNYWFDPSVEQIFGALTKGAKLCCISKEDLISSNSFRSYSIKNNANIIDLPPALLENLLCNNEKMEQVQAIICGGERLNNDLKNKVISKGYKLKNHYGPTECTVDAIAFECHENTCLDIIGKPINNTRIYILDKALKITPIGVTGEIYISGDGLARGYINNETLTSEKFIENPYEPGNKMYKTGDLGRWLIDGNIEFLGRIDHQVKIRGFRIELGEIETNISRIHGVNEVVVIDKGEDGNKYLCAYYVSEKELDSSMMREELKKSLPDYMIPSYINRLEKLPLTSNGKIDRKTLLNMEDKSNADILYEAPRNELEQTLVRIWSEVLGVEKVGINDNFFEIGGHSLKATLLVGRIHEELNVEIPLKEMFSLGDIKGLSRYIMSSEQKNFKNIDRVENKECYEASSAQKRMYILQTLDSESTAYNMPGVIEINGEIDILKVEKAFKNLIERHETLRTSFESREDCIVQIVHDIDEIDFKLEQFVVESKEDIDVTIHKFKKPFNLAKASLLRAAIIKISEERNILLFDMHHIISDGVSLSILTNEFVKAYEGNNLEDLSIQYKDYAAWQINKRQSEEFTKQEKYWLDEFAEEIPVINLPTDYRREKVKTFEGNSIDLLIDSEMTDKLKVMAKETGTTMYMVLLANLNILLSKYSGQEDIIVGSPIAGRNHRDLENVIGMFVNTLAIRSKVSSGLTFKEYLNTVKEKTLLAYENQDYQFEELVENVDITRDLSRNPLFDVMFILQNIEDGNLEIENLKFTPYISRSNVEQFDMTINCMEEDNKIHLNFSYATKLYNKETIQRMGEHFINLIGITSDNFHVNISDIEIIGNQEKNKLLVEFNNTNDTYWMDKTIHELFEEQVSKTPNNVAVVYEDKEITYKELSERSNLLAKKLRELGVAEDCIVGIMVERSMEMIIGMMGVLKAGGAYLPIDPEYPKDRIQYILEDSGVEVLLTENKFEDILESSCRVVNLQDEELYKQDNIDLGTISRENNLAYVIYTSGTTGNPKGVAIKHKNIINTLQWRRKYYNYNNKDIVMQIPSYSFDSSVEDIFTTLLSGAKLVILNQSRRMNITYLKEVIKKHKVTNFLITPGLYNVLLESGVEDIDSLTKITVAGENISTELVKEHFNKFPKTRLYNEYGPTEASVCATCCEILSTEDRVYIGNPISNTRIYILDKSNKLAPIGVPGEICIAGYGLAEGYLNNSDLTSEKFVANPYELGTKMYRTGDLARWMPDGKIEFLGRIDHQIKIRGFRVELGEIESKLLRIDGIKECIILDKIKDGSKYLYAYYVSEKEYQVAEIRDGLKKSLPEYMIPSYFIRLEKMPLTSNGKISRKELLNIEDQTDNSRIYEAPRNNLEEKLVEIWSQVLGVDKIGINDNFFELGGHSLNATLLIGRIHKELNMEIPLKEIFRAGDIKGLSEYMMSIKENEFSGIERVSEMEYYEASAAQKRMYMLQQFDKSSKAYNMPAAIEINGKLEVSKVEKAFRMLIKRHESLRTGFETKDDKIVQLIHDENNIDFNVREFVVDNENEVNEVISSFIEPFSLEKAPLLRASIIKLKEERHILIFDMHHIISDGVSMNILTNEFVKAYEGSKLEDLNIQYKDYAIWQAKKRAGEEFKKQEKYWLEQFSGEIPVLKLPVDYGIETGSTFKGNKVNLTLDSETTSKLKAVTQETGTTMYMVLLANLNILLAKYSEQDEIVVGTPIAGRNHKDLENIIGMFVNTIAIRSKVDDKLSFNEYLATVKDETLNAYENQDYQFDDLVNKLNIKRELGKNPLFDVMFVLQNMEKARLEIEGLSFKPYELNCGEEQFAITISATESNGEIEFNFNYKGDLFSNSTMMKISEYFRSIIKCTSDNLSIKIGDIDLVTSEEKEFMLKNSECDDLYNEDKYEFSF